ncbi:hypothetical protein N9Y60_00015 [Crocinitomicaceae bacterium]|nr:hypothetical protein [Crocinitomicaceae bacterium]
MPLNHTSNRCIQTAAACFFLLFLSSTALGQRVKNETIEYNYLQLPSEPLDATVKNYQSKVTQNNAEKQAKYDEEMATAQANFEQEEAEYPALVAAAE